jgi:hypothetical protein
MSRDVSFERAHRGGRPPQAPLSLIAERELHDASVGGVRAPVDEAFAPQRREHAAHRLRRGVSGAREVGRRRAWVAREDGERRVLGRGQAVFAQRRVHRGAEGVPGLAQQVAAVALDAAVALSDERHSHTALRLLHVFDFADGRISRESARLDLAGLSRQLAG